MDTADTRKAARKAAREQRRRNNAVSPLHAILALDSLATQYARPEHDRDGYEQLHPLSRIVTEVCLSGHARSVWDKADTTDALRWLEEHGLAEVAHSPATPVGSWRLTAAGREFLDTTLPHRH